MMGPTISFEEEVVGGRWLEAPRERSKSEECKNGIIRYQLPLRRLKAKAHGNKPKYTKNDAINRIIAPAEKYLLMFEDNNNTEDNK